VPLQAELVSEIAILSRDEDSTLVDGFLRVARTVARISQRTSAPAALVGRQPRDPRSASRPAARALELVRASS
jgi:hypothetical protein